MNPKLILAVIVALVVYLLLLFLMWLFCPSLADFFLRCVMTFGIFGAVLSALYGDYLREKIFPIDLRIEVPEERNTVIDRCIIGGHEFDVYFHHLRVRNLTAHRSIKNCRVWLKKIFVQQINGEWMEEFKFAVPRLMEWAPSEYSPDQRTFVNYQVFDLGVTILSSGSFNASYYRAQRGAVKSLFPAGKNLRFVFYVTADNYQKETDFCFEITLPQLAKGEIAKPSTVTAV